jgi:hypothetical protein
MKPLNTQGHDLSNFQGKHACAAEVLMGKPTTVAEVSEAGGLYSCCIHLTHSLKPPAWFCLQYD